MKGIAWNRKSKIEQVNTFEEKILSKYDLKKDLIFLLDSIVEYLDAICWAKKRIKNFIESDNRTNTEIDNTLTSENKC